MTELFRSLHVPGHPLVLVNAWDAGSARVVEAAGATAVATTSAGVAWSLGVRDGDALDRDTALAAVRRIVTAVGVPVSADCESGFADDPAGVGETIGLLVATGAAGVNLEDAWHGGPTPLRETADQTARLAAARAAAGTELFVNARVDTYLRDVGDPEGRLADTAARAAAYLDAGADGIFVPGVVDPATVASLVDAIDAPLNILVGPGAPPVTELAALGVARISLGSSVAAAAYGLARNAVREVLASGTYESSADALPYGELNGLFG
ncbi:2-Methylisocitrate lyase, PEP mutase family [Jatrophihabitans endophyticus]|uniref:2-Methylisocitrate lyase, PEP mutase family n=1 Tax=Jatrophihabitans endophyticus TaxID=1206085 RepID=A0A1M5IV91_9ACTN|nr:isocitrate lyase/phosphoenolpyruvate mutase family protein [Jatrophihabitans endophyticus]SHG31693.1 2-Methylisocitrate lyase, PEP mutase family [Jatrophihabitans endophyticus]